MLQYSDQERAALSAYREAITHYEILTTALPGEAGYRLELATSQGGLANMLNETSSPGAEAAYRRALSLLESLPVEVANKPDSQFQLALMRSELADVHFPTTTTHRRTSAF